MEIIKEGNPEKLRKSIKLKCPACECIFKTTEDEYTSFYQIATTNFALFYEVTCPYCHRLVASKEIEE